MTVEFYDLAQRLAAEKAGKPVLRVAQALFTLTPAAVFVEARTIEKGALRATLTPTAGAPTTVTGGAVLPALARAGAQMDPTQPPSQLVMPDGATLAALATRRRTYRIVYHSSSLAGQLAAVESGLAVAVLTRCSVPPN
ncbi:MAG: hypothetical protein U1D00_27835, partial [Mycobacterium sp.]|nr:hypothetical protein [Mycobacterium sp.]